MSETGTLAAPPGPRHAGTRDKPRSLASDALADLRRRKLFWVALVLVVVVLAMAVAPGLFTSADPDVCALSNKGHGASAGALFGYDFQGCNVYARTIYGARDSLAVGLAATLLAGVIGLVVGLAAGYFGGWLDLVLSRITDIVLGVPVLLAAIVLAKRLGSDPHDNGVLAVVVTLGVLGWTTAARVLRSSVIAAKHQDYVAAARMLGAGPVRLMVRHVLPNALAPFVVVLTVLLGVNIAGEATLSYLGVGLKGDAISWGLAISAAGPYARTVSGPLVWPAVFLAVTVLAFLLLGDAVRDAFDPRLR